MRQQRSCDQAASGSIQSAKSAKQQQQKKQRQKNKENKQLVYASSAWSTAKILLGKIR